MKAYIVVLLVFLVAIAAFFVLQREDTCEPFASPFASPVHTVLFPGVYVGHGEAPAVMGGFNEN